MRNNDEAVTTDDETMTKSQSSSCSADDAFWNEGAESLVREEAEAHRVCDLEDCSARFGKMIIDFAKTIPHDAITNRLVSQLVGAARSVGANYVEADDAVSKKDFLKSIGTCRKEAPKTFIIRASSLIRHSSFLIRHFAHAR
jgi:hypothetical protein